MVLLLISLTYFELTQLRLHIICSEPYFESYGLNHILLDELHEGGMVFMLFLQCSDSSRPVVGV